MIRVAAIGAAPALRTPKGGDNASAFFCQGNRKRPGNIPHCRHWGFDLKAMRIMKIAAGASGRVTLCRCGVNTPKAA